jgi:hypothetical protein
MVTVSPAIVQAPLAVMVGVVLATVVAATVNVDPKTAVLGAPVKVTLGAIGVIVSDEVAVEAGKLLWPA